MKVFSSRKQFEQAVVPLKVKGDSVSQLSVIMVSSRQHQCSHYFPLQELLSESLQTSLLKGQNISRGWSKLNPDVGQTQRR